MDNLIDILESFNRKERFFLVAQALGQERGGDPAFTLSENFRQELGKAVGLDQRGIDVPPDAFAAMDYHLDWLHASLVLAHQSQYGVPPFVNTDSIITGNQRDVDLLVAFKAANRHYLILVEAKGYGSWDNDQMNGKAARLKLIFGDDGGKYPDVEPHFCLMSPNRSQHLGFAYWPNWMLGGNDGKPHHLKMEVPSDRRRAERCDEQGNPNANGGHFHCPFD